MTAKVTLKVAENKSFFAPRNVASLEGLCEVLVPNSDTPVSVYKIANSSALYKTRYVTLPFAFDYRLCATAAYRLKNGVYAGPPTVCDPQTSHR